MILRNILQHFPKSDHSELIRIINSFNEVEQNDIIKDIGFVTPNIVENILQITNHFPTVKLKIDGGYDNAVKKKIILYPNYYEDIDSEIVLFEIKYPRKFQKLEHKHILGTLLNNGIRENLIGDIIINEDGIIQIVLDEKLNESIDILVPKINKFNVEFIKINEINIVKKENNIKVYKAKSLRIDAIVKTILRISRQEANRLIKGNKVRVNYTLINENKYIVKIGDVFSIRGYGHYEIEEIKEVNNGYNIFYR